MSPIDGPDVVIGKRGIDRIVDGALEEAEFAEVVGRLWGIVDRAECLKRGVFEQSVVIVVEVFD